MFRLNSVGVGAIVFMKAGYDRIRDLDLFPPMWTMLYGAGGPLAVGYTSFNPFLLPVSWITPFENALVAYEMLLRVVGTCGCYVFLRRNAIDPYAALAAAALFALNVFTSSAGQDPQIGLSIFLLPWLLLAIQVVVQTPSWLAAFAVSGLSSLFYLSCTTQIFSYTAFFLFLPYSILLWMRSAHMSGTLGDFLRTNARLVFYVFVAVVLLLMATAFDLAQQVQTLVESRLPGPTNSKNDLLNFCPRILLISVFLFLAATASRAWLRAIASVGFAVGYWSVLRLYEIDPSTTLSANFTHVSLNDFIFSLQKPRYFFTGAGAVLLILSLWSVFKRGSLCAPLLAIASVGAAHGLIYWSDLTPSYQFMRLLFVPVLGYCALAAVGAHAVIAWLEGSLRGPAVAIARYALVGLVFAEAANMYFRQTIFMDAFKYTRTASPEMAFLAKLGPRERVVDEFEDEIRNWIGNLPLSRDALPRWLFPTYAGAQTLSRVGVPYVVGHLDDFYAQALGGTYFGLKPGGWSPLLDIAAVTHLISRQPAGGLLSVRLRGPDYAISANPSALPRVQLYHAFDVLPNDAGLAKLSETKAGAPAAAVVAPEHGAHLGALDPGASGAADIRRARDEHVEIAANVTGRSLLVLADTFHPGWRAWVDGKPAPIVRANVAFRGVVIERGEHRIEFRFEPDYHRALLGIAGLALALHLMAGLAAIQAWRRVWRPRGAAEASHRQVLD